MSDLSKVIIQGKRDNTVTIKILQCHPDGSIKLELDDHGLKGTALIMLFMIALDKEDDNLLTATEGIWDRDWVEVFPSEEELEPLVKSVRIVEESYNDNWEDWHLGPNAEEDGSSLKEAFMPYVVLELTMADAALLEGIDVGDNTETPFDTSTYHWL